MLLCRSINYYSKRLGNVLETWVVTTKMDEPFYFPNYTQQHLSTLKPHTPSPIPSPVAHGRAGVAQPASPTCLATVPNHPPQEHIPRPHLECLLTPYSPHFGHFDGVRNHELPTEG